TLSAAFVRDRFGRSNHRGVLRLLVAKGCNQESMGGNIHRGTAPRISHLRMVYLQQQDPATQFEVLSLPWPQTVVSTARLSRFLVPVAKKHTKQVGLPCGRDADRMPNP